MAAAAASTPDQKMRRRSNVRDVSVKYTVPSEPTARSLRSSHVAVEVAVGVRAVAVAVCVMR